MQLRHLTAIRGPSGVHIGLITASFLPKVGGLEWKVHHLATEYVAQGHQATVFAGRSQVTRKSPRLPVSPTYPVIWCGFPISGFARFGLTERLFLHAILRCHRRQPLDLLHSHHLGLPTRIGARVKARTGLPLVATTCGADVQIQPELNYGARLKPRVDRMVRENVRHTDVIGSISSAVRADLDALAPPARIVDIPNGVAWDDFQSGNGARFRERLGLSPEILLVLSLGRNHVKKGYDLALAAYARVAPRFPRSALVIVGRGVPRLAAAVDHLRLGRQVHLLDQVPMAEVPQVLHAADLFLNASRVEGFAQVNAQALACGLPCVLTDAPGNHDAGHDGGALIARTGDPASIAAALERLMADAGLRRRLADEALAASRKYAWRVIAASYLEIFTTLVARDRAAAPRG